MMFERALCQAQSGMSTGLALPSTACTSHKSQHDQLTTIYHCSKYAPCNAAWLLQDLAVLAASAMLHSEGMPGHPGHGVKNCACRSGICTLQSYKASKAGV